MGKAIKKEQIAIIIVIAVQFIFMLYWGIQKSGYYVDEFFTFDNAHYISASTPARIKLYDAEFLTYDKWHKISDLKSTLSVKREESLFSDSLGYNIKMWLTGQPYMVLLNYVQAIFFEGKLSKWSAVSMNILLFLLNQLLLYRLAVGIAKDKTAAARAVAIYGFSGMAASMTVYVRFYMLVTLWMTLYTYLHWIMWQEENIKKNLLWEFLSLIVLYLAYKNSPLAVIQGVGLMGAFVLGLFLRKRIRQAAVYGIPIIGGGLLYVIFMTDYMGYIFQPEKYANETATNVATASLLGNFLSLTPKAALDRAVELAQMISQFLFGHILILGIYLLLAVVLFILFLCKKREKTKMQNWDWRFFLLAVCPCIFFCVVSVCLDLNAIRYNSSIFPELAICVSALILYLAGKTDKKNLAAMVMAIVVLGEIVFTVIIPQVENVYQEDRKAVEQIQSYPETNSVVIDYHYDDKVMYECLAFAGENTKVMFTAYENVDFDAWSNDVLLWQSVSEGEEIINRLVESGQYSVIEIGSTHESVVYFISK